MTEMAIKYLILNYFATEVEENQISHYYVFIALLAYQYTASVKTHNQANKLNATFSLDFL